MQAGDAYLGKELSQTRVFVIPPFQRPYVWDAENWEELWGDLAVAAEAAEAEMTDDSAGEPPTYFLGAIVTQARKGRPQRLSSAHVIDGQQRLTTLQVLLAAARQAAADRDRAATADKFGTLVLNNPASVDPDFAEDSAKLVPLPHDRAAYAWATRPDGDDTARPAPGPRTSDRLCAAREWFDAHIGPWMDSGADSATRAEALFFAIEQRIQIVHIMLDAGEDPKVIFEVLNGRGEPLSEADLIKNLLFERGEATGASPERLLDIWAPFDAKPWRDEITTGRIRRVVIDVFLGHWLAATTGKEAKVEDLYHSFRDWLKASGLSATDVIAELRADGDRYLELRGLPAGTPLGDLVDVMEVTQTTTPWPLVLAVATRRNVPDGQVNKMATAIASLTMRRAICGMTTKDYNNLFLAVLNAVRDAPDDVVGERVTIELAAQESDARRWPSDSEFLAGLLDANLYNNVYRARLRSLLVGLENHLRTDATDLRTALSARESRQVEHLLPQRWVDNWPVDFTNPVARAARSDAVHRLGNLTLLTGKLNAGVSNSSWAVKRSKIQEQALLRLTTSSVFAVPDGVDGGWTNETWSSDWDEERIRLRSRRLATEAVAAWPRPAGGPEVAWEHKLVPPPIDDQGAATTARAG